MNDFLRKIFSDKGVSPSEVCLQSFDKNFADAINVEWHCKQDIYEAVFYYDNLEHIALFDLQGSLLEYRQYLPIEYVPRPIYNVALSKGEIMNAVLKNKGNKIEYELIINDSHRNRYMLIISNIGELIKTKEL